MNKVILIGHVGQDPETREIKGGNLVANLSLATSESYKDKNTGERIEKTEWHRLTFFGQLAELVQKFVEKGSKISVVGKLQTEKYEDRDGNTKYTTKILCNELYFLGKGNNQNPKKPNTEPYSPESYEHESESIDDLPF